MADGYVPVDSDAMRDDGRRLRPIAVESSAYPGGVNYRCH
jgi:hypothetical protein